MNTFYRQAKAVFAAEKAVGKKDLFLLIGKILVSAAIIIYLLQKINFENAFSVLRTANNSLLLMALLLSFVNLYLQFVKWRLITNKCLNIHETKPIFLSLMHGLAAGSFTPARVGEYVGRKLAFPHVPLFKVTIATIVDKLFSLFITLGFGSAAAILFLHFKSQISGYITIGLFIIFFFGVLLTAYLLTHQSLWNSFFIRQLKQIRLLKNVAYKFSLLKSLDSKTLWLSMALNVAFYSCFLLQYGLLLKALAPTAQLTDTLWAGSLMFFAKTIIPAVSLGELGIREGASVFFAKQFAISEAAGLSAAIAIFIINIALPALAGMLLFFKKNNDK